MRKLAVLILASLMLSSCSSGTGSALMAPGGECTDCDLSHLEPLVPVPKHGVLFAIGGWEQTDATFVEVDWDKAVAGRYVTDYADPTAGSGVRVRVSERVVHISKTEEHKLKAMADDIWRDRAHEQAASKGVEFFPVTVSVLRCRHSLFDLYLIDGDVMRHEEQRCAFEGDEQALQTAIETLLNEEGSQGRIR